MGLDDLVPDDKQDSGSSRSSRSKQKPDKVSIGNEPHKKVFEEEKWEEVKSVLLNEMGLVPNKVVNNYPAAERYEVLHEAALVVDESKDPEELDNYDQDRCYLCDTALGDFGVEIEGEVFCDNHPVAQVRSVLDEN